MKFMCKDIMRYKGRLRLLVEMDVAVYKESTRIYTIVNEPSLKSIDDGIWLVYRVLCNKTLTYLKLHIPLFLFSTSPMIYGCEHTVETISITKHTITYIKEFINYETNQNSAVFKYDISSLVYVNKYIFGEYWLDLLSRLQIKYNTIE